MTYRRNALPLRAETLIRDVPDFPKPGILFKDITPVLADPQSMREVIDLFAEFAAGRKPDVVVGIESRGFVLGMPLAMKLGVGFVPVRKLGKLPYDKISEEYALEYGTNTVEIHSDSIKRGQRALIVDDLLATGGTAAAAARLIERLGGSVCGFSFMVDLAFLDGRASLNGYEIQSRITLDCLMVKPKP
jgi:adenine phosphoribosyltransferase